MPFTDHQGSLSHFASLSRSILSMRREQASQRINSMDANHVSSPEELGLESFQKQVAERFHDLLGVHADQLLSVEWMQKLLDAYVWCQEEFRVIMLNNSEQFSKPPLDRMTSEFLERTLKALDICNAIRSGIERIRFWQKNLEIVLYAFESLQRSLSEGRFQRARKALMDLALAMLDDRYSCSVISHRNRSFGRHNTNKDVNHQSTKHSRSLSWSVSRNWSAAKQLSSIANNLVPPRGNEVAATKLAVPVFTMNTVLTFVLWALVAAIPCQDRGLSIHFSIPQHFSWSTPVLSLYDRIMEESKRRERRNSIGLLREIFQVEQCTRQLTDFIDSVQLPLADEQKVELEQGLEELALVCGVLKTGLDPLERQVREMFRRIIVCRNEGLEYLSK